MIARLWTGRVPIDRSDEYLALMRSVAIPDYRAVEGSLGAYALRSEHGDIAEFTMLTFWESEASVARFAGDDVTVAKYYGFDAEFLLEMVPRARHVELYDS